MRAAAEAKAAQGRAFEEQRQRADQLAGNLALTQREVEPKAEAVKRREAAETSLAQAKRALDEERQKVGPLERGLAVAHQSIEALQASAKQTATTQADAARSRQLAEAAARQAGEALTRERERAASLSSELSLAQRDLERLKAEAVTARNAAQASQAETRQELGDERGKVGLLERDLAQARQAIEGLEASAKQTATTQADAARSRQLAEAAARQAGEALTRERERAASLSSELSLAQRDLERLKAEAVTARNAAQASRPRQGRSLETSAGRLGCWSAISPRPVRPSKGLRQAQSRQRQRRLTPHGAGSLPKRLQGRLARRSHGNAKGQPLLQATSKLPDGNATQPRTNRSGSRRRSIRRGSRSTKRSLTWPATSLQHAKKLMPSTAGLSVEPRVWKMRQRRAPLIVQARCSADRPLNRGSKNPANASRKSFA